MGRANYLKLRTNLRLAINRLKLLEKKKTELALKSRREIADYISSNKDDRARIRVEHIVREDYLVEAMEIIEMYCDLLLARFGLIEKMIEMDPGLEEAIATILWASPRLSSDIPEIIEITKQLTSKYGKEYVEACRKNSLENVNEKVLHKMSLHAPPKLLIENYMIEIAKSYNVAFTPDLEALEGHKDNLTNTLIDLRDETQDSSKNEKNGGHPPPGWGGGGMPPPGWGGGGMPSPGWADGGMPPPGWGGSNGDGGRKLLGEDFMGGASGGVGSTIGGATGGTGSTMGGATGGTGSTMSRAKQEKSMPSIFVQDTDSNNLSNPMYDPNLLMMDRPPPPLPARPPNSRGASPNISPNASSTEVDTNSKPTPTDEGEYSYITSGIIRRRMPFDDEEPPPPSYDNATGLPPQPSFISHHMEPPPDYEPLQPLAPSPRSSVYVPVLPNVSPLSGVDKDHIQSGHHNSDYGSDNGPMPFTTHSGSHGRMSQVYTRVLPDLPDLPSVPSDSVTSSNDHDVDFDDLSRRFEALKKK